jgi:hypothetical protein
MPDVPGTDRGNLFNSRRHPRFHLRQACYNALHVLLLCAVGHTSTEPECPAPSPADGITTSGSAKPVTCSWIYDTTELTTAIEQKAAEKRLKGCRLSVNLNWPDSGRIRQMLRVINATERPIAENLSPDFGERPKIEQSRVLRRKLTWPNQPGGGLCPPPHGRSSAAGLKTF